MKTMLRNLARKWANQSLVRSNDSLRRELIADVARLERQTQAMRHGETALNKAADDLEESTTIIKELRAELDQKDGQIERQADLIEAERAAWASTNRALADQVRELQETVVALSGKGLEHQCPEGLLVDGVELHRCIRNGGHDGNHWNRGREREWAQLPEVDNIEVPW